MVAPLPQGQPLLQEQSGAPSVAATAPEPELQVESYQPSQGQALLQAQAREVQMRPPVQACPVMPTTTAMPIPQVFPQVLQSLPFPRPAARSGAPNHEQQFRFMRRRVLLVSLALAILLVVQPIISYIFDFAQLEAALESFREVADLQSEGPKPTQLLYMFSSGVPSLAFGILVGLLVPLCGYLGVKHSNQGLMCAFCGCNCLSGCCSIVSILGGGLFLCMILAGSTPLEHFLTRCDPSLCLGNHSTSEAIFKNVASAAVMNRSIDCLAAGLPDYSPRYDGPKLPEHCPAWVFIECPPPDGPEYQVETWKASRRAAPKFKGMFKGKGKGKGKGPPLPEDADGMLAAGCTPNGKVIKAFHAAQELAPSLLPRLMLFIAVKMAFTVPVAILACLGFCWGNDFYGRLNQGYNHMGDQGSMQQMQSVAAPIYQHHPYPEQQMAPMMMPAPRMMMPSMTPAGIPMPGSMPVANVVPVQLANPAASGPE